MWTILGLVAALLALPLVLRVLAMLFMRTAFVKVAEDVGRRAVEQQPESIHLSRRGAQSWADASAGQNLATPLFDAGFEDAGNFGVDEMPGVMVRLLAHPGHSLWAVVYEHPRAGHWVELVTRYEDRTSASFTSLAETGVHSRPGHPTQHLPGVTPQVLLECALAQRPGRALLPVSADQAVRAFEDAYAESIAWRKEHGVAAADVARMVLKRKAA